MLKENGWVMSVSTPWGVLPDTPGCELDQNPKEANLDDSAVLENAHDSLRTFLESLVYGSKELDSKWSEYRLYHTDGNGDQSLVILVPPDVKTNGRFLTRSFNLLARRGIKTPGQLLKTNLEVLYEKNSKGFGEKTRRFVELLKMVAVAKTFTRNS